jgi:hypothetical protein
MYLTSLREEEEGRRSDGRVRGEEGEGRAEEYK